MTDTEADRLRVIVTEIYALDLARVLRHAVNGDAFWRFEARKLLRLIDNGEPPPPRDWPPDPGERQHQHQEAA